MLLTTDCEIPFEQAPNSNRKRRLRNKLRLDITSASPSCRTAQRYTDRAGAQKQGLAATCSGRHRLARADTAQGRTEKEWVRNVRRMISCLRHLANLGRDVASWMHAVFSAPLSRALSVPERENAGSRPACAHHPSLKEVWRPLPLQSIRKTNVSISLLKDSKYRNTYNVVEPNEAPVFVTNIGTFGFDMADQQQKQSQLALIQSVTPLTHHFPV